MEGGGAASFNAGKWFKKKRDWGGGAISLMAGTEEKREERSNLVIGQGERLGRTGGPKNNDIFSPRGERSWLRGGKKNQDP